MSFIGRIFEGCKYATITLGAIHKGRPRKMANFSTLPSPRSEFVQKCKTPPLPSDVRKRREF